MAGMEAAAAARAVKAQKSKQGVAEAAEARRRELADALAPLGVQLRWGGIRGARTGRA